MKTLTRKFAILFLTLVFLSAGLPGAQAVSFTVTGSLRIARGYRPTMTLLPDGTVLAAGGADPGAGDNSNNPNSYTAVVESYDPLTGTWTTNAPLPGARSDFTATLLTNGLVLVAGGFAGNGNVISNATLFNPANGTWTLTGSMHEPRLNFAAQLLPNGKVLVTGGGLDPDGDGFYSSPTAELYDPVTGIWSLTGAMNHKRQSFTLTLLSNGKVLAVGGNYSGNIGGGPHNYFPDFTSAELYDPATGNWTATGSLPVGRVGHTATGLTNGTVLVTGGLGTNYVVSANYVAGAVLYNPDAGTWSDTGSPGILRSAHTATLLPNGTLLVTGGNNFPQGTLASAEVYDPLIGAWAATGSLYTARTSHSAVLLQNGKVLVAGGYDNSAEIYDSSLPVTVTLGNLSQIADGTPKNATAMTVPAGLPVTFYYNGSTTAPTNPGTYTVEGTVASENHSGSSTNILFVDKPTLTIYWGDDFYFAQPYDGTAKPVDAHAALSFRPFDAYTPDITYAGVADAPTNAGVYVVQAATHYGPNPNFYDGNASRVLTILYSAADFMFTNAGVVNIGRQFHTSTLLTNGQVLIAGGLDSNFNDLASSELYDSTSGIWTATGDMNWNRSSSTATLLRDGRVLVTGGVSSGGTFQSNCELYNSETSNWAPTGALPTGRFQHTATRLSDGKVLVAGGQANPIIVSGAYVSQPLNSAVIFDPETEAWTPTGDMDATFLHEDQTATLLPSGKVLIAGGYATDYSCATNAELFDPKAGAWRSTTAMNIPRARHTATGLPDGRVLVAGGRGSGGPFDANLSAEIYDPATELWTVTGPMHHAHTDHTANLLTNGLVLVVGGGGNGFDATASAEIFYPALGIWSDVGDLTTNRTGCTASLLINGQVLIVGGWDNGGPVYDSSELSSFTPWIVPVATTPILLTGEGITPEDAFQFSFTNTLSAPFTVLTSTDLANWTPLPGVREISPGKFHFTDPRPAKDPHRTYQVRSP